MSHMTWLHRQDLTYRLGAEHLWAKMSVKQTDQEQLVNNKIALKKKKNLSWISGPSRPLKKERWSIVDTCKEKWANMSNSFSCLNSDCMAAVLYRRNQNRMLPYLGRKSASSHNKQIPFRGEKVSSVGKKIQYLCCTHSSLNSWGVSVVGFDCFLNISNQNWAQYSKCGLVLTQALVPSLSVLITCCLINHRSASFLQLH